MTSEWLVAFVLAPGAVVLVLSGLVWRTGIADGRARRGADEPRGMGGPH